MCVRASLVRYAKDGAGAESAGLHRCIRSGQARCRSGGAKTSILLKAAPERPARRRLRRPPCAAAADVVHLLLHHAATGFTGITCRASRPARNAALFAIMGSIVSSLTMPVVLTTAAISGA